MVLVAIPPLETDVWYRLQNTARPEMSLDVINDGRQEIDGNIHLAPDGDFSGQHWQLRPSKTYPGYFNLCTLWLGTNRCLDVYGDDATKPHLAQAGNFTGQQWQLIGQGGDVWKLTNTYSGPDLFLDVKDNDTVFMSSGHSDSQKWLLVKIRKITETGFSN